MLWCVLDWSGKMRDQRQNPIQGWVRRRTQFHLLSKRACADISLTGHRLLSSHCIIVSFFGWVEGLSCSWSILEMSPKMFLERRPGSYKHFHLAARRNRSNLSHKRWLYFFPAVSKQRQLCLTLTLRRWRAGALDALGFALSFSFCLTFTTFHFCVWKAAI